MHADLFGEFHRFLKGIVDRVSLIPQVGEVARALRRQGAAERDHLLDI